MGTKHWNIRLEDMTEAGVHFGHQARQWNPKMAPYILTERKGIHITDLTQTARSSSEARDLVAGAAARGKQFLIVGTRYQAADVIRSAAIRAQCHYVNEKRLGGTSTNWLTTEARPQGLEDLEDKAEQRLRGSLEGVATASERQLAQLRRSLGGIRYMKGLPDTATVVDQRKELTAVRERAASGIPTIRLVDTDCDPDLADTPIPANDDPRASIRWIPNKSTLAVREGRE
nr:ribosomal protein S2 [Selaginella stauntoniana]